jgi:chromosome partitioning protein
MILAIIHDNGGTGKTTSAVNRTAGLAMNGHRALLADRDSQASASRSLGIERAAFAPSVADAILDG